MREALPRSVRTEAGVEPPWVGEVDGDGNALLRFSRAGPEFNLEAGSGGQRIGYRLRNGSAEVLYWPRFDQPSDATPNAYALANGIAQLHIDYLDPSGNWLERWPPSRDSGLPRAVHVSTTLAAGGVVDRYFTLQ